MVLVPLTLVHNRPAPNSVSLLGTFDRGSYTWIAIIAAIAIASTATFLLARRYMQAERGQRYGPLGETIMFSTLWVVVFGVAFGMLYVPSLIAQ